MNQSIKLINEEYDEKLSSLVLNNNKGDLQKIYETKLLKQLKNVK